MKPRLAVFATILTQATPPAPTRIGAGAAHTSCVVVVHAVVAHSCPETYAEGLTLLHWKFAPRTVIVAAPETWEFRGEKEEMLGTLGERNVG